MIPPTTVGSVAAMSTTTYIQAMATIHMMFCFLVEETRF
jgi:hypothetical protein